MKRMLLLPLLASSPALAMPETTVVDLTQTHCQFLEPEHHVDHDFAARSKLQCVQANEETGKERSRNAETLALKAGPTDFRVTNLDVPYDVGFYLRGSGLGRLTLPKAMGMEIAAGETQVFSINLKPGEYVYSCPLNPTLEYRLVVTES